MCDVNICSFIKEITRNYVDLVLANGNEAKAPCNFEAKEISASVARCLILNRFGPLAFCCHF